MDELSVSQEERRRDFNLNTSLEKCSPYVTYRNTDDGLHLICNKHRTDTALGDWPTTSTIIVYSLRHREANPE